MKPARLIPLLTLAACAWLGWAPRLLAQATNSTGAQQRFVSPEAASLALRDAAEAGNKPAVEQIFGPGVNDFLTGDPVQDNANFKGFSLAMADRCKLAPDGPNRVILTIGTNDWPFPIPLVKQEGQWFFDTDAGREEVINRHIGRDELNAIGVCRTYVKAQKDYYAQSDGGGGRRHYALKFKSSPGEHDGLYWPATKGPSPLDALVMEAHAEGYGPHPEGNGPHPFHGYFFRILTAQGRAAPGGRANYLADGNLTGGFAMVAYPDKWNRSGIMTFIVNQDGKVYQRNLGEKTAEIASAMTQYNPDSHWTLVDDVGVNEP